MAFDHRLHDAITYLISFQFDDEWIEVPTGSGHHHHESLLSFIRARGATKVKQMCEEGGCGACSLLELSNNGTELKPVSACLIPLAQASDRVFVTSSTLARTKSGAEMVKLGCPFWFICHYFFGDNRGNLNLVRL